MNNKIGFIGCGKMAGAIIRGIIDSKFAMATDVLGSEFSVKQAKTASEKLGIRVLTSNKTLVNNCNIIFIATKPNVVEDILTEIKDDLTEDKLIVSIAAGVKIEKIEKYATKSAVVRAMPNTPALVLEGMSAVAKGTLATDEQLNYVKELLSKIGKCITVLEPQIDIVTAISGSGPAFFYKIFDDMARAGQDLGLSYEKSLLLAIQTAIGSAKMVMAGEHLPVELIKMVATKGGCTEVGIDTMIQHKTDKVFSDVIKKTTQKAFELG